MYSHPSVILSFITAAVNLAHRERRPAQTLGSSVEVMVEVMVAPSSQSEGACSLLRIRGGGLDGGTIPTRADLLRGANWDVSEV